MTDDVHDATVERLERAVGSLGTDAMNRMERLSWFRRMSAENRSWVGLVAQAGIAAFVDWFKNHGTGRPAITGEVFGTAPRELTRAVTLQQTVELVRVVIDVVEARTGELAAHGGAGELHEAMLRYSREVAFGTALVYARAAEARGAWDARLEALIVDALLRGEIDDSLHSWAAALGWSATQMVAIAGHPPDDETEAVIDELRTAGHRAHLDVLAGVQGDRLVVIAGHTDDPLQAAQALAGRFGAGPVVVGPLVDDLKQATRSASVALAGLRAAPGWPDAPRPVHADDLLPERILVGDAAARSTLLRRVYEPLRDAGSPLLDTLTTYLEHGTSLEATARLLFVHPNTVRYRLRRIADLTGYLPSDGRSAFILEVAVTVGRLRGAVPKSDNRPTDL